MTVSLQDSGPASAHQAPRAVSKASLEARQWSVSARVGSGRTDGGIGGAGGEIEQRQEHLRLLRTRNRIATLDDETRHRVDAKPSRAPAFGQYLDGSGVASEISAGGFAVETGARGNRRQRVDGADVDTVAEIGA